MPAAAAKSCCWSIPAEGDDSPVSLLASLALGSPDESLVMNSDYSLAVTGAMEKQGQEMLGMVFAGAIKGGVNLSYGNRIIETVRQRKSFVPFS